MQSLYVALIAFVAVAYAKPQLVEWFQIKPSINLKPAFKERMVKVSRPLDAFDEWVSFKKTHMKTYTEDEENSRFEIFRNNLKYIEEHNHKYDSGEKSYYLGINQFADMKHEEFIMYNGFAKVNKTRKVKECSTDLVPEFLAAPESVNWTSKGYVTPIKNQGQCGSCWSFSTTGSLEGQHFRSTGKLVSLSEQQLVDCSAKFGNEGCNGGLMDNAFEYIESVGGIESEDEYPYEAKQERKCHFHKNEVRATVSGCVDVESGDEDKLKMAVAKVGPVSVAIDASHQSFQMYDGGVYDEPECSSSELDHGVLVVGYGTYEGSDYWLVKNSWGTVWGDLGYVMMTRNKDNQCGIATQASYPLV